jgi:VWFA-related protein
MQLCRAQALHALSISSVALLLAAGGTACLAQAASAAAPVTPPAPQSITIDAYVTDKMGHHQSGLGAQDFTLLDNKHPARILDIKEVDGRNGADPVRVLIVIDAINTDFTVVAQERGQLMDFLNQDGGRLAHPTALAVLTEKGIKTEQNFTTDGAVLSASMAKFQNDLRTATRSAGFWGATERLQWSLNELGQLTAYEAGLPGRKLAIFISPGWPMLPWAANDATEKQLKWVFSTIEAFSNQLREGHVTLYAIDPYILGRTDPFFYESYLKGITKTNDAEYGNLALQVLAAHSGGLVLDSGLADVKGGINNAIRDANACYTITFAAPPVDGPNEYHDLHLQVDKPGAVVRTTAGYYSNVQR